MKMMEICRKKKKGKIKTSRNKAVTQTNKISSYFTRGNSGQTETNDDDFQAADEDDTPGALTIEEDPLPICSGRKRRMGVIIVS